MVKNRSLFALSLFVAIVLIVTAISGCSPAVEEPTGKSVIRQEDRGFVCLILIDMSGSYAEMMAESGKGHRLIIRIIDKYFRDRLSAGTNDRIIIGQLSAAGKPTMLLEATPLEVRQKFPSPAAFRDWLRAHSDERGSRLYDGIREGITYILNYPGVSEGRTKTAVFVASDMDDNQSGEKGINYLLGSFTTYAKLNGVVSLLFVEPPRCELWNRELQACGFKPGRFTVQSAIVENPDLPSFSDD